MRLIFLGIIIYSLLIVQCTKSIEVTGGTHTGNGNGASVSGIITTDDAQPVSGILVQLMPQNQKVSQNDPSFIVITAVTDSSGRYTFDSVDVSQTSFFNIYAEDTINGTSVLILDVVAVNDSSVELNEDKLNPEGTLVLELSKDEISGEGIYYIQGTNIALLVDSISGDSTKVILSGVPSDVSISIEPSAGDTGNVVNEIEVTPGDTTILDTIEIKSPYPNWMYSQTFVLNTRANELGIEENVIRFPMLIKLDSSNFDFSQAKASGFDARFAKQDGSSMGYHVERWNTDSSFAFVWVLLDTIYANKNTQEIEMYWGNPNAKSAGNYQKVFEGGNGFTGVWHLSQTKSGTGNEGVYKDRSVYANHGIDYITSETTRGLIGYGVQMDGAGERIEIPDHSAYRIAKGAFTISVWFKKIEEERGDLFNWESYSGFDDFGMILHSDETMDVFLLIDNVGGMVLNGGRLIGIDQWTHAAVTRDENGNMRSYINGETDAVGVSELDLNKIEPGSTIRLGGNHQKGNITQALEGVMDEFRMSNKERSPGWIMMSYENQRLGSTWLTVKR